MASMEEKIQIKRQRTETFIASLPGQSKKVRVVTFTQAQLPKAHVTETGGLLGMVLFNDGQATFQQDNTSFVRALLMNSNYPNIYNYSSVNQYPQVPHWQNGAALPVYGDCTVDSITARIKSVAEDKGQAGLRMASLEFDIVPSKEDLIMRDATAAHICRSNGIDVPPAIAQAYQNQLLENPKQTTTPPRACGSTASSPGSSASHAGSVSSGMQAELMEGLKILRGIKHTMQARNLWVEEDEQNKCAPM